MNHLRRVACCFVTALASGYSQPVLQGLGDLPGGSFASSASGVSDNGELVVVGQSSKGSFTSDAFRWTTTEGMQDLGNLYHTPSEGSSSVYGISGDGSVIMGLTATALGDKPYIWTSSSGMAFWEPWQATSSIGAPVAGLSWDGGVVVGTADNNAYRWDATNGLVTLPHASGATASIARAVSSDGNVVVGRSGYDAFRWTSSNGTQSLGTLTGTSVGGFSFTGSEAVAASANGGVIVGGALTNTYQTQAFVWTEANGMTSLGHLPGGSASFATGVSADGSIIIGQDEVAIEGGGRLTSFIWSSTAGMLDFEGFLVSSGVDLTGWSLTYLTGISPDGTTVVGTGYHNGNQEAFVVTGLNLAAIPEPSTYGLLFAGAAFGFLLWKRRSK